MQFVIHTIALMISLSLLCQMRIFKSIIGIVLIAVSSSNCSSIKINQAAATNDLLAIAAINQIKESGIVVIFPTEHKKEKTLIQLAKSNISLLEDINKLKTQRAERIKIWQNTKEKYSFSKISIVPDSLLKSYIIDPNLTKSIGQDGELAQTDLGNIYVLFTDYGGFEVKRNGNFLPNPFPSKVQPAWGSSIKEFIGVQSKEKSINRFFTELNKQLNLFYIHTKMEGN